MPIFLLVYCLFPTLECKIYEGGDLNYIVHYFISSIQQRTWHIYKLSIVISWMNEWIYFLFLNWITLTQFSIFRSIILADSQNEVILSTNNNNDTNIKVQRC